MASVGGQYGAPSDAKLARRMRLVYTHDRLMDATPSIIPAESHGPGTVLSRIIARRAFNNFRASRSASLIRRIVGLSSSSRSSSSSSSSSGSGSAFLYDFYSQPTTHKITENTAGWEDVVPQTSDHDRAEDKMSQRRRRLAVHP